MIQTKLLRLIASVKVEKGTDAGIAAKERLQDEMNAILRRGKTIHVLHPDGNCFLHHGDEIDIDLERISGIVVYHV